MFVIPYVFHALAVHVLTVTLVFFGSNVISFNHSETSRFVIFFVKLLLFVVKFHFWHRRSIVPFFVLIFDNVYFL